MLEAVGAWIAGKLFEVSAMWGIRSLLIRTIGRHLLNLLKQRFQVVVPERGHYLRNAVDERDIVFYIEVRNPTRHRIVISGGCVDILYQDIVVSTQVVGEVEIQPETQARPVEIAQYNPFLHPLGLPVRADGWRVRGHVMVRSYYGEFDKSFESQQPLAVSHNGKWEEARDWVRQRLQKMRGDST